MTTPMPGPWLSPNVVTVRIRPNVLPGTFPSFQTARDEVGLDRLHPLLGIQQPDGNAILFPHRVEEAHHDAVPLHAAALVLLRYPDPRNGRPGNEYLAAAGPRVKIQAAGEEHQDPDGRGRSFPFNRPVVPADACSRGEQERVLTQLRPHVPEDVPARQGTRHCARRNDDAYAEPDPLQHFPEVPHESVDKVQKTADACKRARVNRS
jgi:hypothetical protein